MKAWEKLAKIKKHFAQPIIYEQILHWEPDMIWLISRVETLEASITNIENVLDRQSCNASLYEVSDDDFGMLYHLIHTALQGDENER